MGIKRKLYENIARHLKGGAWARVGRTKVWALGAERIRLVSNGYTFGDENVYVSQSKRIRFRHDIRLGQVPNLPPQATVLSCFILMG